MENEYIVIFTLDPRGTLIENLRDRSTGEFIPYQYYKDQETGVERMAFMVKSEARPQVSIANDIDFIFKVGVLVWTVENYKKFVEEGVLPDDSESDNSQEQIN